MSFELDDTVIKRIDFGTVPGRYTFTAKDGDGNFTRRTLLSFINELRADQAQRYAGVYTDYGSDAPTRVLTGPYAPTYPPVSTVSAAYNSTGIAEVTVDYYMAQNDYFTIEVLAGDGTTVVLATDTAKAIDYPKAGQVRLRTRTPIPANRRGFPTQIKVTQKTSGDAAVQKSVVWPALPSFATNPNASVYYYINAPTANKNVGSWRYGTFAGVEGGEPILDATGTPIASEFDNGRRPAMFVGAPAKSGQRTRLIVTGTLTGVRFEGENTASATNRSAVQSANGESWVDFDWNWDQLKYYRKEIPGPLMWIEPQFSGTPYTNCRMYEINDDGSRRSPGYWDKDHITINSRYAPFLFGLRFMDMMNTVGTSGLTNVRITQAGDVGQTIVHSVPDMLDLLTLTGCTGRFHVPLQAQEAWVRTEARRTAVWAKRYNKPVMWTLSNEIWNTGQGAWQTIWGDGNGIGPKAAAAGLYTMPAGSSNHDHVMRYWSYRHKQVMKMITEEFAAEGVVPLLVCNIDLQNDNPGNNPPVCEAEPGIAQYIQSLSTAPYIGFNTGPGLAATDTATVAARIKTSIPEVYGKAATTRNYATAHGWAFFEYEGAFENIENPALWHNLLSSQDGYDLLKYMIAEHQRIVGGNQTFYTDYRPDAWGLTHHVGQTATFPPERPSMFARAWYEAIAEAVTSNA